jgi:hypothetical protein
MAMAMFLATAEMSEKEFVDLAQDYNQQITRALSDRINNESARGHIPVMQLAFEVENEIFTRACTHGGVNGEEVCWGFSLILSFSNDCFYRLFPAVEDSFIQ